MNPKLTRENLERLAGLPNNHFDGKTHTFEERYVFVKMDGRHVRKELAPYTFDAVDSCYISQSVRIIARKLLLEEKKSFAEKPLTY